MLNVSGARQQTSIEHVSVQNVMNPILWLCGLITIPSIIAIVTTENPHWVLFVLAIAPVFVALFAFLYFMFKAPDRLQSESYQLRKQALELIEEKGGLSAVDADSIEVITNPDLVMLENHKARSKK